MKKITSFILTLCLLSVCCAYFGASAATTEVSKGASYTLVTPASEGYPDDGKKLTNGKHGTHQEGLDGYYAGGDYVGFNKSELNSDGNFTILVDLGKVYDNLTEFSLGYLNETSVGITAPKSVSFSVSTERNGKYTDLGKVDTVPSNPDASATYEKTLETEPATGRYVLVTVTPSGYDSDGTYIAVPWTFIDEITVRANANVPGETNPDNSSEGSAPDSSAPTADEIPDTPATGDSTVIFAFVLLALSAFAMMFALFSVKKSRDF